MNERLDLRDVAGNVRARWAIPLAGALAGLVIGGVSAVVVSAPERSEATVLVGPTNGAVTHTSTIRTSEDLASFYADMARRQVVLEPVVDRLELDTSWSSLRNQVSAVVPKQNLRLVTVTVTDESTNRSTATAQAIIKQLVTLSPPMSAGDHTLFANEQAAQLKTTIVAGQREIEAIAAAIPSAKSTAAANRLRSRLIKQQEVVTDWQKTFVALVTAEPTSDAGALQVLDEATPVASGGRLSPGVQGLLGAAIGGVLGMLVAWLYRRRSPTEPEMETESEDDPEPRHVAPLLVTARSSRGTGTVGDRARTDDDHDDDQHEVGRGEGA